MSQTCWSNLHYYYYCRFLWANYFHPLNLVWQNCYFFLLVRKLISNPKRTFQHSLSGVWTVNLKGIVYQSLLTSELMSTLWSWNGPFSFLSTFISHKSWSPPLGSQSHLRLKILNCKLGFYCLKINFMIRIKWALLHNICLAKSSSW